MCEERLQFSLSENVKTNVLWGSTVKDTVMIRPWSEQIAENSSELVTVTEQNEDERYEEGWIRKSAFVLKETYHVFFA